MATRRGQLDHDDALALRDEVLDAIDPHLHFNRLFDHLPGMYFFAKDREGHILFANRGLAELYGYESEDAFVGCTDYDVLPAQLADKFRADDVNVMEHGRPLLGIVELFLNPQGIPDWYLTNKLPIWSRSGQVMGIMGSIQAYRGRGTFSEARIGIERTVAHLRAAYAEDTPVSQLAEMSGLPRRQFEEEFKAIYDTSPHQFRIRLRVTKACALLRETQLSVSQIAAQSGFYDQSALSHHLKTITGYTPLQYRKRFN